MKCTYLLISLFVFFAGLNTNAQPITFTRGTAYNISLKDSLHHFLIPIEAGKGFKLANLRVKIKDTRSDKQPDQVSIDYFKNPYFKDTLHDTVLNIDVDNNTPVRAAVYTLVLLVNDVTDSTKVLEKYTISITVNAAQLATLATAVVEMKESFFGSGYTTCDTMLPIRESGKKTWLTNLTIDNLYTTDPYNHKIGPVVTGSLDKAIAPGAAGKIIFKTKDDLPLGKSIAVVDLVSPQLSDPVSLNIEITTRKGAYFLITFILLGLLVGFILRTFLTGIINTNTAKLPAFALLRIINEEINKRNDPAFIAAANTTTKNLNAAVISGTSEEITSGVTIAKTALENALNDFAVRLAVVTDSLNTLKNTAAAIPQLPDALKSTLGDTMDTITSAGNSIESGAIEDAAKLIRKSGDALNNRFYDALEGYASNMQIKLEDVRDSRFPLPEIANDLPTLINLTKANFRQSSIDKALFTTIQNIDFSARTLLGEIARSVHKQVEEASMALLADGVVLPDAPAVQVLKEKEDQLHKSIIDGANKPEVMLNTLASNLNELSAAMIGATSGQIAQIVEKDEQKVANVQLFADIRSSASAGRYKEAAEKLVALLATNPQEKKRGVGPVQGFAAYTDLTEKLDILNIPAKSEFKPVESEIENQKALVNATYQNAKENIAVAKWIQNILSALLIIFVGYLIYGNTFVGTNAEIASVFFWAFFLDVSMNTISSAFVAKIIK